MSNRITKHFESLSDSSIKLLSLSSLFDKDFSIDWLIQLTNNKASCILSTLEKLCKEQLLINIGNGWYRFSDFKSKESFQCHLSNHEKQKIHRRISTILMNEASDDENKAIYLTKHLMEIENDIEGCKWLIKAAEISKANYQIEDSLQIYSKAIDDLLKINNVTTDKLFVKAALNYSKLSTARQNTDHVIEILKEAMTRTVRNGDKTCKILLEMHMAKNEWLRSHPSRAFRHFKSGMTMAQKLDDSSLMPSVKTFGTFFLYWKGLFKEAVTNYEEIVPTIEKYPQSQFPILAALTVGHCYAQIGQITQGIGMMDGLCKYCREKGDKYLSAHGEFLIGASMLDIRRIEDAFQFLDVSLKEAKQEHNEWTQILGWITMAFAHYLNGDTKQSTSCLRNFLKHSSKVHVTVNIFPYLLDLCWAMEEGKLPRISGLNLENEIKRALRSQNYFLKAIAFKYLALLKQKQGFSNKKIIQSLNTSISYLKKSGHQLELSRTRIELARQLLRVGQEKKAKKITMMASKVLSSFNEALVPNDLRSIVKTQVDGENLLKEILKISQDVVSLQKSRDLFNHIISSVNRITGAERGAIFFLEGDNNSPKFKLMASKNLTTTQTEDPEFKCSLRLAKEVLTKGKGLVVCTDSNKKNHSLLTADNIRSKICVPMIMKKKIIGVLYHDNRILSSAFNESDLVLLTHFAALAAFAIDNARAYEEIQRLNYKLGQEKQYYHEQNLQRVHFEEFVGVSSAINHIRDQIAQVAQTDATVLILGETGVGKDLVARAIHRNSKRKDKPFIQVNCNSLPESLLPSELFGHEKGAFTGAAEKRVGRFELADRGSMFLDEIGDMPSDIQVRLLRILQTKKFERVGGTKTIESDFRLISATNRDLKKKIEKGEFRTDLFYRLNVFPIYIPPLRERKKDIPILVHFFVQVYSKKTGKRFKIISEEEIEKLVQYDWPGNVRELENIIERSIILSQEPHLKIPELVTTSFDKKNPLSDTTLKESERRQILWALDKTEWKVKGANGAAELLDIHPSTLFFRMRKLGIQRPEGLPIKRKAHLKLNNK